jgi:hypothetical protein
VKVDLEFPHPHGEILLRRLQRQQLLGCGVLRSLDELLLGAVRLAQQRLRNGACGHACKRPADSGGDRRRDRPDKREKALH